MLQRLYSRKLLAVSKHKAFIGSASDGSYRAHLYDVILWVAGIEAPREGELHDVIKLYVPESQAVLLGVND